MRLRTLGAVSALAVLVAVVAAMPASGGSAADATATYIVQLVQAPVAGYQGGISGYPATKPAKGKKLNAHSDEAKKYAGCSRSGTTARSRRWAADRRSTTTRPPSTALPRG